MKITMYTDKTASNWKWFFDPQTQEEIEFAIHTYKGYIHKSLICFVEPNVGYITFKATNGKIIKLMFKQKSDVLWVFGTKLTSSNYSTVLNHARIL